MHEDTLIIHGYIFVRTCFACPEQYDVYLGKQQVAYVRLRHGRVYASNPDVGGKVVYQAYPEGDGIFASDEERDYHLNQIVKALDYEQRQLDILKSYLEE